MSNYSKLTIHVGTFVVELVLFVKVQGLSRETGKISSRRERDRGLTTQNGQELERYSDPYHQVRRLGS